LFKKCAGPRILPIIERLPPRPGGLVVRIGLYHEPVHTDGHTFDTYGSYARYVLEFARHFDDVTVFAPVTDQPTYFSGCPLAAPNVTVAPLPYFETHIRAYRHAPAIVRVFRRHCDTLDVINARGTAPLAYVLWWLTRRRGVPFLYHFSSDPFEMIARSPKYRGPYRWFAWSAYSCEFAIQKHIMRRNYSFTDGSAIAERLRRYTPNVEPIVLSTLQAEDYYVRDDSCTGAVVRVLYVGYLRQGKGLDDLLEALGILRRAGRNVELELVSEGSPRVIIEALGHSLPVVATPVGNIAELLANGQRGLLVPMNDPAALAAGIARLIDDGDFRRRCIHDGYAFARQHGLDAFVARMAEKAKELIAQRRRGS
jgi:glycosyltransferase involved in cell wall biosynthesis